MQRIRIRFSKFRIRIRLAWIWPKIEKCHNYFVIIIPTKKLIPSKKSLLSENLKSSIFCFLMFRIQIRFWIRNTGYPLKFFLYISWGKGHWLQAYCHRCISNFEVCGLYIENYLFGEYSSNAKFFIRKFMKKSMASCTGNWSLKWNFKSNEQ